MRLRYKLISVGAILAGVFLWGRCSHKQPLVISPLSENVSEKVSVKNGVVTIQTPTSKASISGVREGSLTIMKDGTSKLDIRTYGWEHQVGMNGIINSGGGALGLDLRFFYYKQFDALSGIDYAPLNKTFDFWLGIGYTFKTSWMSNTTFLIGYSVHNNPVAGISVRF